MVWLYRSHIPVGRWGITSAFKWFQPVFAIRRGRGEGAGTLCTYHLANQTCQTKPPACILTQTISFIAVHHWHVPSAALHLPNQTPACIVTLTISFIAVHHWPVPAATLHLPNQTPPCILTQTIFYCSPSLACSFCCPIPAKPNPCMHINSDYFLLQSIIGLFLLLH